MSTPVEKAEELLRSGNGIVLDPADNVEGEACASLAHISRVFNTTRATLNRDLYAGNFFHNGIRFVTFKPAYILDVLKTKLLSMQMSQIIEFHVEKITLAMACLSAVQYLNECLLLHPG